MGLYSILSKGLWEKVAQRDIGELTNTFTIDGLDGNRDQLWYLYCRFKPAVATDVWLQCRINNDTGVRYGWQQLYAAGTAKGASRNTAINYWLLGRTAALAEICIHEGILYPKAGTVRTMLSYLNERVSGTSVLVIRALGQIWNNSVNNITSLVFFGSTANIIGPGTHVELWRKLA